VCSGQRTRSIVGGGGGGGGGGVTCATLDVGQDLGSRCTSVSSDLTSRYVCVL